MSVCVRLGPEASKPPHQLLRSSEDCRLWSGQTVQWAGGETVQPPGGHQVTQTVVTQTEISDGQQHETETVRTQTYRCFYILVCFSKTNVTLLKWIIFIQGTCEQRDTVFVCVQVVPSSWAFVRSQKVRRGSRPVVRILQLLIFCQIINIINMTKMFVRVSTISSSDEKH